MIFKQDYKLVVNWDINGTMYWQLFKKGEPIIPNENEKELVNSVLKLK
jgi:hypothetical protein